MKPLGSLPYAPARRVGDYLLMSGVVPLDADGRLLAPDFEGQFRAVWDRISDTLGAHAARWSDVVGMRCYLASADDFAVFNRLYAERFAPPLPVRTTVVVTMAAPGILLELEPLVYLAAGAER